MAQRPGDRRGGQKNPKAQQHITQYFQKQGQQHITKYFPEQGSGNSRNTGSEGNRAGNLVIRDYHSTPHGKRLPEHHANEHKSLASQSTNLHPTNSHTEIPPLKKPQRAKVPFEVHSADQVSLGPEFRRPHPTKPQSAKAHFPDQVSLEPAFARSRPTNDHSSYHLSAIRKPMGPHRPFGPQNLLENKGPPLRVAIPHQPPLSEHPRLIHPQPRHPPSRILHEHNPHLPQHLSYPPPAYNVSQALSGAKHHDQSQWPSHRPPAYNPSRALFGTKHHDQSQQPSDPLHPYEPIRLLPDVNWKRSEPPDDHEGGCCGGCVLM